MTLTDAIARFETQLRADGRSKHTVSSYLRALAKLQAWTVAQGRGDVAVVQDEAVGSAAVGR